MDKNQVSVYAKKIREVVRVLFFILRKSKRKLLVDLNLALKRSKLAGKSLIGKLSHHHHNHHQGNEPDYYSAAGVFNYPDPKANDYVEFSCSNTPAHHNNHNNNNFLLSHVILPSLHLIKKGGGARGHKPQYFESVQEEMILEKAIESALNDAVSTLGSPALPGLGFGQSPAPVRQLRVTDSPYPVNFSGGGSDQVDAAAEEFIKRFYSQLKRQPLTES